MMSRIADWRTTFCQQFPNLDCKLDFPLKQLTYFKVGGPAELFVSVARLEDIAAVRQYCHAQGIPLVVLGGASNVIVDDAGVKGVVLKIAAAHFLVSDTTVTVGAGLQTALLVRKTVDAGLSGLEYFLGVPGSVGGAVYNNAHYLSHLMAEYITRVRVIDVDGTISWVSKQEAEFAYDHSRFQHTREVIWEVEFELPRGDEDTSRQLIREATEYRAKTQPLGLPSSGCIFQNVPNTPELKVRFPQFAEKEFVPGGFLIDQAGLKGMRLGDLEVSQKHAAFMVNHGAGTSQELKQLISQVQTAVWQQFGVKLQEEVFYLQ